MRLMSTTSPTCTSTSERGEPEVCDGHLIHEYIGFYLVVVEEGERFGGRITEWATKWFKWKLVGVMVYMSH